MRAILLPIYLWLIKHRRVQEFFIRAYYRARFEQWKVDTPPTHLFEHGTQYRNRIYERVNDNIANRAAIHYLEFGVFEGASIRWWMENNGCPESTFVGFDSFLGLPVAWHERRGEGHFDQGGRPPEFNDQRCSFEVGWFDETIPCYFRRFRREHTIIAHCDADLYGSTLLALTHLAPLLQAGDIVIFDEFSDFMHEFRALIDCLSCIRLNFEVVCATGKLRQLAIRITDTGPAQAERMQDELPA